MRRNSRHLIIYVLFGILIAAFIISFGPQSRGVGYTGASSAYAVKVGGATVSEQDFHFAYVARGGTRRPVQLARQIRFKEQLMDMTIERELLANEAVKLGFEVSPKEAEDMIMAGNMLVMGERQSLHSYVYKDGKFDYDRFKLIAQNELGVSVKGFIEIEQREMLAEKLRESLRVATKIGPDEVKQKFTDLELQVNLEYARFPSRKFEDEAATPSAQEIDAYVKAHEATLKKQYDERAFRYKNLEREAKLRHIVIDVPKEGAPAGADEAAKTKLGEALKKLKAGSDFAQLARELSSDERSKKLGGEIGWRKKKMTGFGDGVEGKVFAAKANDYVGPERTPRGWELIQVQAFREGDVPVADAEREMAEEEVRRQKAMDKAKAEAQAVLDRVHKGEKLETIVPKETPNPNESPQERQLKAMMAQGGEGVKLQETGLFTRHGDLIQDIGISKDLAKRAFELKQGEVAGPFEVTGAWVVVRVKEHRDPDLADFEKRKAELTRQFERVKAGQAVTAWAKARCTAVKNVGDIKVNNDVLEYEGLERAPVRYDPCAQGAGAPF